MRELFFMAVLAKPRIFLLDFLRILYSVDLLLQAFQLFLLALDLLHDNEQLLCNRSLVDLRRFRNYFSGVLRKKICRVHSKQVRDLDQPGYGNIRYASLYIRVGGNRNVQFIRNILLT